MAKADWAKKFGERIEEAIDNLEDDALSDDIREAVDWSELVKEIIREDPAIKKKIRDKVTELIESHLENADGLGELAGDDDFDFLQHLPDGGDIGTFISKLLESGQPLRKKLEAKLVELVGNQIDGSDTFEELTGDDDFNWYDHLPEDWSIVKVIAELLESDKELRNKLKEKLQELALEKLDNLDEDDMPEWEEFAEMLGINDIIRQIINESNEVKEKLTEEIRGLIHTKIEEGLEEDSLPDDLMEKMDLSTEVKLVLADREFRAQISEQLQKMIREFIVQTVNQGSLGAQLAEKVKDNPEFSSILDRQVNDMMRNPELILGIKSTIKERLTSDPEVGQKIMNAVFEEVARGIVAKLFKGY
jgi:hypothetical protein